MSESKKIHTSVEESENAIMDYLDEIWEKEPTKDVCKLCGSPDQDKVSDHLRMCYKASQDELDNSCFKPRYMAQEDMNTLERGFNMICGNRRKCFERQKLTLAKALNA